MTAQTRIYFEDSREVTGTDILEEYTVYVDRREVGTLLPADGEWRFARFLPSRPIYNEEGDVLFSEPERLCTLEEQILEHFNGRKVSNP